MIILDTNVVSEAMKSSADETVMSWMSEQPPTALWTTAVTVAEVLYGLAQLPAGRRRAALESKFDILLDQGFPGRVLPFDQIAAEAYATIMSARRSIGRPMSTADGQIAAVAASRGARIATRNITDFESCGLDLIDPWAT